MLERYSGSMPLALSCMKVSHFCVCNEHLSDRNEIALKIFAKSILP